MSDSYYNRRPSVRRPEESCRCLQGDSQELARVANPIDDREVARGYACGMWWTRCSECGSETELMKPTLLRRLMTGMVAIGGSIPPVSIRRRCPRCGVIRINYPDHAAHECQRCGYDLRNNRTGECPECGWKMPAAMRDHLEG